MSGVATHISHETDAPRRVIMQRRTVRRVHVDYPVTLQTTLGLINARVVDISERGAKLRFDGIVEPSASARLRFDAAEVYCAIVWSRDDKCGVEFDRPLDAQTLAMVLENATEEFTPVACAQLIPFGQKRGGRLVLDQ